MKTTIWRYHAFKFFFSLHFFGAVLVPFFTDWGRISTFQIFFLQSWFALWCFLLEVPTGAVADYLGRKYSIALGALLATFGTLLYGSVPSFTAFLIGEFILALSFALISGADEALLYDALKEEGREKDAPKIFGTAQSINLTALLIASLTGSVIAAKFGLNAPLLLTSVPFFIAAIFAWSIKEPRFREKTSESRRYSVILKKGLTYLYKHKFLQLIAVDAVIVSSSASFVVWFYQPMLKSINMPILWFGVFHAIMFVAEILVSSNFSKLKKLAGSEQNYFRWSALIVTCVFLLVAIKINLLTISLFLILGGGVGYTRLAFATAYMNRFISSAQRATVLSSVSMMRRFALIFLYPIAGFIADKSMPVALFFLSLLPLSIFFFSPMEKSMLED